MALASSSTLGTGRAKTHQERIEQEEHHEIKRALDGRTGTGKRKRSAQVMVDSHDSADDSESSVEPLDTSERATICIEDKDTDELPEIGSSRSNPVVVVDSGFSTSPQDPQPPAVSSVGSALKLNSNGNVIAPRISKKKVKSSVRATCLSCSVSVHSLRAIIGTLVLERQDIKTKSTRR